jgi:hypothetical protein
MAETTGTPPRAPARNLDSSYEEQDRREQRNMDHRGHRPEPKDPDNPASKPQGTVEDQVANMESEGQGQEPVEPDSSDSTATMPPGHQKEKRTTL